jgi:hypothetical protein
MQGHAVLHEIHALIVETRGHKNGPRGINVSTIGDRIQTTLDGGDGISVGIFASTNPGRRNNDGVVQLLKTGKLVHVDPSRDTGVGKTE